MPATYETLSQGGHEVMATEIFTKIKSYLDTHGVDSKVSKSGDTMTGGLNFANNTWNVVGDDVQIGDKNVSGHLCIQGVNGETGIRFMKRGDDSSVCNLNWNGTVLATSNNFQCNGGNIKAYVNSTGESQVVAQRQTTTTYIFANADGRSGVYSNKGNLLILDSNNKLSIGGKTYAIGNAANFRSALGLGSMATQNTGSYPTTTTVPSGYRVRAGTKVVTVTGATATVVFTQAEVNSITGATGCTGGNTVVYVSNGDYNAQSHYISACIYNPSNKTWCMASVYNGAFTAGSFRANYIVIKFA